MKPTTTAKHTHLYLRADQATLDALDKIAEYLVRKSPGLDAKRIYAHRAALLRGIESYLAEIAATKPPRKPTPKRRGAGR